MSEARIRMTLAAPEFAAGWLRSPGFESLPGVNEAILELLAAPGGPAGARLDAPAAAAWYELDAAARARAACCPYLLAGAHFDDEQRWGRPAASVDSPERPPLGGGAAGVGALRVARLVYTYAWHLVRAQPCAARLVLGIRSGVRLVIGELTLPQVDALATCHPEWLAPLWPGGAPIWSALFRCAALADPAGLECVRLHGLQLLAGKAGAAPAGTRPSGAASPVALARLLGSGRHPPVRLARPRRGTRDAGAG